MATQSQFIRHTTYEYARPLFRDGDIVFFSQGKKNIVRRLITWFTRSPHYHVGIAFWVTGAEGTRRLMLAESQPDGFRIINLGFYQDRTMTVFECPVEWGLIQEAVVGSAGGISYDFLDLFLIGMHERFGVPIPGAWTGAGEVCSALVAKILQAAGMALNVRVSPGSLYQQFIEKKLMPYMVSHN